jgi:hypothetical protein
MIRASQAFAAYRQAVISELNEELVTSFLPQFNAEVFDIQKQFTDTENYITENHASDDANNKIKELAEKKKHARTMDLMFRKNKFLESLTLKMKMEMLNRVNEYGGEQFEEMEEHAGRTKPRKVLKAKFPDGSVAKIPQQLHIDWSLFQRV